MRAVKFISVLSILIFISNFSAVEMFAQSKENSPVNNQSETIQKVAEPQTNQSVAYNPNNDRYRIGYQDTIEVTVVKHPDLSLNTKVNPDGTIYLPRLESPIIAVCKTENELRSEIVGLYKKNVLREPFVTVRVSDQKSQGFAVIGAVKNPGSFYINRKVKLLELLSLAGGQDLEFSGGKIQVARIGSAISCQEDENNSDKEDEFFSYSLDDVLEGKQNPWMKPGDIISILKSEEAYVVGNVFKPAKVQLDKPKTLTQAIAIAGGKDATASDKVVIRRQASGSSEKSDLIFSLNDIKNNKIPDPQLQANDIVDVGTDKIKSVRNGLLKAITGGLGNVFYRFP